MAKSVVSKTKKTGCRSTVQGECKLEFAVNSDGTRYYYKTKSGSWCNLRDMNIYGLRYILERLEKEGKQSSKIYRIVSQELTARRISSEAI